jgi:dihydrofolate synthase/folylpolyglutamate synthase
VIARRCKDQHATLVEIDEAWRLSKIVPDDRGNRAAAEWLAHGSVIHLQIPLAGKFQVRNALTAAAAAKLLMERGFALDEAAIERGIANVQWPGRLEQVAEHPDVYLDGAHNPAAARELRAFWDERLAGRRIILVYGAMRDKAVDEIAGVLFPRAEHVILTQPHQSRAISADVLARMTCHHAAQCESIADATLAIDRALLLAGENCAVFITGSLFLVGEARSRFCEKTPNLHIASR